MKTCPECGVSLTASKPKAYAYDCDLDAPIPLHGGVTLYTCQECDTVIEAIANIEDLHRVIARLLAIKDTALTPREIRFLRTSLGFASDDMSDELGIDFKTFKAWEAGTQPMPLSAERLLRLLALTREPKKNYPASFKNLGAKKSKPLQILALELSKGTKSKSSRLLVPNIPIWQLKGSHAQPGIKH